MNRDAERGNCPDFPVSAPPPRWSRNRRLAREGFGDLAWLPRSRSGWNSTLSGLAFSARRRLAGRADLDLWAAMHNCPASVRCAQLGDDAIVLWHGTSDSRAKLIRDHGLKHKRGVWATLEPRIAHGFTRGRSREYEAGSATIVLVLDRREVRPERDYSLDSDEIARFHRDLPPDRIEYILWDDRVEFVGQRRAHRPAPWGVAHFRQDGRRWAPKSRPPVRMDAEQSYSTFDEWLELSVRRILTALGEAAAVEVFSSLYATVEPWDALRHRDVLAALERLCNTPSRRHATKVFALKDSSARP